MDELIELFEMLSANHAALRADEKMAVLKAKLALSAFERAMASFKRRALATAASSTPALHVAR